jgi:2,4-dienoyl-CoA reductase-like NADH-dependent reductase (Old Yellow Enzyme family)
MADPERTRHERFSFSDRGALLDAIAALRLKIPFSEDLSPLFEPIAIQGTTMPNRLAIHPMEGADSDAAGAPGELTARRYRRFAAGGCGLIWFEAMAVKREGRSNPAQLLLNRDNLKSIEGLVKETRRAAAESLGDGHRPLLIVQITHSGRFANPDGKPKPKIAAANPLLEKMGSPPAEAHVITDEELDQLKETFVEAAGLAGEAGFDGVDIKACHGYLVSELLSAFTREDSQYGGSFENRTRFLRETIQDIRRRWPDLIATCRLNALDGLPHPHGFGSDPGDPSKEDFSEAIVLSKQLKTLGCPLLNVSVGVPALNPHYGRPFNAPLKGADKPDEHPLVGVERLLRAAAILQNAVPGLPVVGTGYSWLGRFFPHVAAAVLEQGMASLIGLGRQAFACPDFALRLMRDGRLDPDALCTGCSGCSQLMRNGKSAGCVVRDRKIYLPLLKEGG